VLVNNGQKRWGAAASQWAHFKKLAKADLLPVVSDPTAELSPRSKMKAVGKTPSIFNQDGLAVGITDWPDHETTVINIDTWSKDPRLGISLQTRRYRAFDIDVDDEELADEIEARILELLGIESAPARGRSNSGKRVLLVYAEGELSKDAFPVKEYQDADGKTKRWLVELLATGQQFIACGMHTSGVPYEWRGGMPARADVPTVSIKRILSTMETLKEEFAVATWKLSKRHPPTMIEDLNVVDPVAEHLIEHDLVLGEGKGQLYVECPWIDNHSGDRDEETRNISETSWLLAGTGRYRNGHFSCRHTGCLGSKTDADFLKAVGYRPAKAEEFEDLTKDDASFALHATMAPGASAKSKELKAERQRDPENPLPAFKRFENGQIETSLENVVIALGAPQASEVDLAFDHFRGELMIADFPGQWREMTDADAGELRIRLEALGFKHEIGKEKMRDALEIMGNRKTFDAADHWLRVLVPPWDGVPRIHRFWPDYMKTKDTPYTRALGEYNWTAQAGRVLDPGCKVDMVPVLVGDEGTRKSTAVSLLAPHEDFFTEFNLGLDDEKLSRLMRGCLVGELAELRGISARDAEGVLAWVTRKHEKWTPKFKEYAISLARRLVFYGTTNDPEFLQAHMGQRRWLPVMILETIDTDAIIRDREQLWAEAREVFLESGIAFERVEKLARAERKAFEYRDAWFDPLSRWLDTGIGVDDDDNELTPRNCGTLTAERVLIECFGFDAGRILRRDQQRVGEVLKACGMVRNLLRVGGKPRRVWVDAKGGE
jgi:hypothetical protein